MSTSNETKLLQAIGSAAQLTSVAWGAAASKLNCTEKAVKERFRRFKAKFPLPADHKTTDGETQLLLAVVSAAEVTGVDWAKASVELGCSEKAVKERYRRFKAKVDKVDGDTEKGEEAGIAMSKKGGKAKAAGYKVEKDADGGNAARKVTKRKATTDAATSPANKKACKEPTRSKYEDQKFEIIIDGTKPSGQDDGQVKKQARAEEDNIDDENFKGGEDHETAEDEVYPAYDESNGVGGDKYEDVGSTLLDI